jgi:hypothetical protein
MPPYKELYPVGTKVRVAGRAKLDDFLRTWKFHHPLAPEQLLDADRVAEVINVGFYHGGDVLYGLRDVPGTWHEECLLPEWLDHFRTEAADFRRLEPSETELVGQWVPVGKRVMGDVTEKRIEWLTQGQLRKLGCDSSGWEVLFVDEADGRYWELTYPHGEMHGGGPKCLSTLSREDAVHRYPRVAWTAGGYWTDELRKTVQLLIAQGLRDGAFEKAEAEASMATGALPVYCDMGGCLLIRPDSSIFLFDWEHQAAAPERDPKWLRMAAVRVARRYPALAVLAPQRPADARACSACSGTGLLMGVTCGECVGTGWV